jgi:hypothetical protein
MMSLPKHPAPLKKDSWHEFAVPEAALSLFTDPVL